MAYVIGDACIGCGLCAADCPLEAISPEGSHYKINPDICQDCGTCAVQCPEEAIYPLEPE